VTVAFQRGIDGPDSVRPEPAGRRDVRIHRHRTASTSVLAEGTLACPVCDAPVAPPAASLSPADPLGCGFCSHAAAVRDFLSLTQPTRPARVVVRLRQRARR
jgi:hypothetical protein